MVLSQQSKECVLKSEVTEFLQGECPGHFFRRQKTFLYIGQQIHYRTRFTCQIHDLMHDVAQSAMEK
jgi:hypothetical protein